MDGGALVHIKAVQSLHFELMESSFHTKNKFEEEKFNVLD